MQGFREKVVAHLVVLQDGWTDWFSLLSATDVIAGVFRVDDAEEIQARPEEFLDAHVEEPMVLLGYSVGEDPGFIVFNHTKRRWRYWPVYRYMLEEAQGQHCVVFLTAFAKHVEYCEEGKIWPIMPLSRLADRHAQLQSYLFLSRLDPVLLAHLVARPNPRVDEVVEKLRAGAGDREAAQAAYDKLVELGVGALPGILHEMADILIEPGTNRRLDFAGGIRLKPPEDRPEFREEHPASDTLELMCLVVNESVPLFTLPLVERAKLWANVRRLALYILAREEGLALVEWKRVYRY